MHPQRGDDENHWTRRCSTFKMWFWSSLTRTYTMKEQPQMSLAGRCHCCHIYLNNSRVCHFWTRISITPLLDMKHGIKHRLHSSKRNLWPSLFWGYGREQIPNYMTILLHQPLRTCPLLQQLVVTLSVTKTAFLNPGYGRRQKMANIMSSTLARILSVWGLVLNFCEVLSWKGGSSYSHLEMETKWSNLIRLGFPHSTC